MLHRNIALPFRVVGGFKIKFGRFPSRAHSPEIGPKELANRQIRYIVSKPKVSQPNLI